jgi:hypothetical protein
MITANAYALSALMNLGKPDKYSRDFWDQGVMIAPRASGEGVTLARSFRGFLGLWHDPKGHTDQSVILHWNYSFKNWLASCGKNRDALVEINRKDSKDSGEVEVNRASDSGALANNVSPFHNALMTVERLPGWQTTFSNLTYLAQPIDHWGYDVNLVKRGIKLVTGECEKWLVVMNRQEGACLLMASQEGSTCAIITPVDKRPLGACFSNSNVVLKTPECVDNSSIMLVSPQRADLLYQNVKRICGVNCN